MTKITVLGSGTAVSSFYKPFDFRAPPGYLLEHGGKQYLIECSDGIRGQLEKIKIDYFNTDSIFISHFHPDHFSILPFIQSIYVRTRWANQKKEINIYGPKGLENRLKTFWEMTHFKGSYDERIVPFLKINFFCHAEIVEVVKRWVGISPHQPVNFISFFKKRFGKVRAVLTENSCYQSFFCHI